MKPIKFLGVLLVLVFLGSCASTSNQPAATTEIIRIVPTGKNTDDAFTITMQWMNKAFVSAKNVIQYSDKDAGIITGKAIVRLTTSFVGYSEMHYTLSIELKDSRARLTFKAVDLVVIVPGNGAFSESHSAVSQAAFDLFAAEVESTINNYTEYVNEAKAEW